MPRITRYISKKISEIIKPGDKVLIEYECGLGDVIMFLPYYERLKQMFPEVKFDLKTKNQGMFFKFNTNPSYYNWIFRCASFFNEEKPELQRWTKPECNCVLQLGIPYDKDIEYTVSLPHKDSPFVGVSYCNSCFPENINCNYEVAKLIWDKLRENGFVPIELFSPTYKEAWERDENKKFDFVSCSMRDMGSNLQRMLDVMATCRGLASVATGNFHYGMTIYPDKILYLMNKYTYKYFTNKEILCLDVNKPDIKIIEEWIKRME